MQRQEAPQNGGRMMDEFVRRRCASTDRLFLTGSLVALGRVDYSNRSFLFLFSTISHDLHFICYIFMLCTYWNVVVSIHIHVTYCIPRAVSRLPYFDSAFLWTEYTLKMPKYGGKWGKPPGFLHHYFLGAHGMVNNKDSLRQFICLKMTENKHRNS